MPRQKHPQIVTANDLFEGDVIYLTGEGGWTRVHGDAAVADDPDEAQRLLAIAQAQPAQIVGAYLADAAIGPDGRPQPVHFREAFRTRGPSNYFHGKQAEL
ncbi:MAG: DUF2849 domain-containing protein [Phyllobacteriaceae bacterium]|nr:DUF2849 domain-containing protein [Phyllobacteriaceae bacterium]